MKIEKQVTSSEISKKLKELGVKQESLWAWWVATDRDDTPALNRHPDKDCPTCGHPTAPYFEWISAFTVAEVGEILPDEMPGDSDSNLIFLKTQTKNLTQWFVRYENEVQEISIHTEFANTEADARGKMLIYLLENNLLTL